jgi:serine/threonine protein kinase
MMVMEYAKNGSLRQYLKDNFESMKWIEKLNILQRIANGLDNIHIRGLIHHDFHCGNVLFGDEFRTYIADLGLCRPAYVKSSQNEVKKIYGVLPYVAPEVIKENKYTQESDIYGFGIIAYEICTGLPPYYDMAHDESLFYRICKGYRPESNYKVPQLILNIIKQCWDAVPSKRPKAKKLYDLFYELHFSLQHNCIKSEIYKQVEEAEKINVCTFSCTTNAQAVYTSRLLDFKSSGN